MNIKLVGEEQKALKQFPHLVDASDSIKGKIMILDLCYEYEKTKAELEGAFSEDELNYINFILRNVNKSTPIGKNVLISRIRAIEEACSTRWRIDTNEFCKRIESLSSFSVWTLTLMGEELFIAAFEHYNEPQFINLN